MKMREHGIPGFTSTKGIVEPFASPKAQPEGLLMLHYIRRIGKARNVLLPRLYFIFNILDQAQIT